jgi:hypothetical protein
MVSLVGPFNRFTQFKSFHRCAESALSAAEGFKPFVTGTPESILRIDRAVHFASGELPV